MNNYRIEVKLNSKCVDYTIEASSVDQAFDKLCEQLEPLKSKYSRIEIGLIEQV